MILAARVLTGPVQFPALLIGAAMISTWLIGRRPTLCIDTKHGDRHMLHGPDSLLLRTQMMINRLCDGKTLEEAREGLEEIQRNSNFPAVAPLLPEPANTLHVDETAKEAELLPEIGIFDESDLEQALKAMYHGDAATLPEPKPTPEQSIVDRAPATELFSTESPADHAGKGLLDRARTSLYETRSENTEWSNQQNLDQWSKPWEQASPEVTVTANPTDSAYERAWGRNSPDWYSEKQTPSPENRFQSALVEAKEEAGTFFSSEMFDDPGSQTTDTGIFGNMFDSPADTQIPEPQSLPQPEPAPTWSGQAIRDAKPPTSHALATTLPEPTPHALREECVGVVAAARRATPLPTPEPKEPQSGLDEFPAIGALFRNTPNVRQKVVTKPKRGVLSRLTRRGKKALIRAETKSQQKSRPVKIEGDDYADVYGDDDGFENGEYREVAMRSGQILRLRVIKIIKRKSLKESRICQNLRVETSPMMRRMHLSNDCQRVAIWHPLPTFSRLLKQNNCHLDNWPVHLHQRKPWPPWYLTNGLITAILPFGDTYPTWRDTHLAPDQQFLQHQTVRG